MEEIKNLLESELIVPAAKLLENNKIANRNYERPSSPVIVFYLGHNSFNYYEEMNKDLHRGWGILADNVRHIKVETPDDFENSFFNHKMEKYTVQQFQSLIDDSLDSNVFGETDRIKVYCILNTKGMDVEEFNKWYSSILSIRKLLPGIGMYSSLFLMLDQTFTGRENNVKILRSLLDIYKNNNEKHDYSAVYLFSNRLNSGGKNEIDPLSPDYVEYNILADLILITNTNDNNSSIRVQNLYNSTVPAFTAAYSNIRKPNNDIVIVTLKRLLEEIRKSIVDSIDVIDIDGDSVVKNILHIENNRIPIVDKFYENYIRKNITINNSLDYLPNVDNAENVNYSVINEGTFGCLDLFVKANFLDPIQEKVSMYEQQIKKEIETAIFEKMNVKEYKDFIFSDIDIDNIVENIFGTYTPQKYSNNTIKDAIMAMAKDYTKQMIKPVVKNVLIKLKGNSAQTKKLFEKVYNYVCSIPKPEETGLKVNIESFYSSKIDIYFNDESKIIEIIKRLFTQCEDNIDIIKVLFDEIKEIYKDEVFSLSFVDEFLKRVNAMGSTQKPGRIIASNLTKDLGNKIPLSSVNAFDDRFFEAYFVSSEEDEVNGNAGLQSYLDEQGGNVQKTYYNTLSDEMVESIWFYKCRIENLYA